MCAHTEPFGEAFAEPFEDLVAGRRVSAEPWQRGAVVTDLARVLAALREPGSTAR